MMGLGTEQQTLEFSKLLGSPYKHVFENFIEPYIKIVGYDQKIAGEEGSFIAQLKKKTSKNSVEETKQDIAPLEKEDTCTEQNYDNILI